MVIKKELTSISKLKNDLLIEIGLKISNGDIMSVNFDIDNLLKIDITEITILINTIERKIRDCEYIYYTFLENIDNAAIAGNSFIETKIIEVEFNYNTKIIKCRYDINDHEAYREIIDSNFQNFILLISSLYENLVRLTEILLKKIIIHTKKTRPISSPYYLLLEYWDLLIALEYRTRDNFFQCIDNHKTFLNDYTEMMNRLRNRYTHGYKTSLFTDGTDYRIEDLTSTSTFTSTSPYLCVNIFSDHILENTKRLIKDFLEAILADLKIPGSKIPM